MSDFDPTDLEALAAAKKLKEEHAAFLQRREIDDFKWLMQDKRGRRIVYGLLAFTGAFRNPFVAGQQDLSDYNCGLQSVGQKLFADIQEYCPEHYETMLKEKKDDNRTSR